ncbi:transposase, MuDR, MULE transposase domain protein [Tanacetum coccineum]
MKDMSRRHGLNLTYSQAYRSKNKGLEMLMGSPYESFQKLPYYCYNLRNVNPGTRTNIKVDEHGRFEMLFIALGVAIDSFMNYLRPLVIIDGAHLKDDVYHGVNLLAVGMDGNNQTLPIAFGICQGEDGAGWTWFLEELKACISQKPNLSIISDRHPAILESVKKVFPNAFHGFCCRHLMMNAAIKKERHKAVYWEACKAYTTEAFDECMDYIQSAIPTAYVKLVKAGFIRWSRAHCPANRYNYLTSNSAESVNSLSRRARKLPVTHLMEFFRALLQRWYYERRYEGDVDEHELTPWAAAKVAYRIRMSFGFSVHGINSTKYQVVAEEINYIVDLRSRTCTCRRWQLSGLPCSHVIAVSTNKGYTDLGVWAEHWFKKTTYKSTYANSIYPVGDVEAWNIKCNVPNVLPPSTNTRPARRPKKKDRIRSKGEMPKKTYCSRCYSGGHDRNACHEPAPSQRSTYGWDN